MSNAQKRNIFKYFCGSFLDVSDALKFEFGYLIRILEKERKKKKKSPGIEVGKFNTQILHAIACANLPRRRKCRSIFILRRMKKKRNTGKEKIYENNEWRKAKKKASRDRSPEPQRDPSIQPEASRLRAYFARPEVVESLRVALRWASKSHELCHTTVPVPGCEAAGGDEGTISSSSIMNKWINKHKLEVK